MDRRRLLATIGGGLALTLSGCSTTTEFEPDVEPVKRLGAAPRVSMEVTAEKDIGGTSARSLEERATERAAERLRTILERESLTGRGISVGEAVVDLEELTHPADAERPMGPEFERVTNWGPSVFHYHHYSRDGELVSKPHVGFQAIVDATPRSFEVTMDGPEDTYVVILPAMCRRGWIQNT